MITSWYSSQYEKPRSNHLMRPLYEKQWTRRVCELCKQQCISPGPRFSSGWGCSATTCCLREKWAVLSTKTLHDNRLRNRLRKVWCLWVRRQEDSQKKPWRHQSCASCHCFSQGKQCGSRQSQAKHAQAFKQNMPALMVRRPRTGRAKRHIML